MTKVMYVSNQVYKDLLNGSSFLSFKSELNPLEFKKGDYVAIMSMCHPLTVAVDNIIYVKVESVLKLSRNISYINVSFIHRDVKVIFDEELNILDIMDKYVNSNVRHHDCLEKPTTTLNVNLFPKVNNYFTDKCLSVVDGVTAMLL